MKGCNVISIGICLILTGCGEQPVSRLADAIEVSIVDLQTKEYRCERIQIKYGEEPRDKDHHKADYFCFYNLETEELWDIVYYDVGSHEVKGACSFGVSFEDINFDGHEDFLIENVNDGEGSSYYSAYLWTEEGFCYEDTFDEIGNYQLEPETGSVIEYRHSPEDGTDWQAFYHYTRNGFECYKEEYTYLNSGVQKKITDMEKKMDTYYVRINPNQPICG